MKAEERFERWQDGLIELTPSAVYEMCLEAGKTKQAANAWQNAAIKSQRRPSQSER